MQSNILTKEKDPMGAAILDYQLNGKADKLRVFSSNFEEDEIPVRHLFRSYSHMSAIEKKALDMACGKILDVGAGSGCHTLALMKRGKSVRPIDISPLSVEAMKMQGIENTTLVNLFDADFTDKFDTIIMLMNGSGIVGRIRNLPIFFDRLNDLLNPDGCVLMDSSDLSYLYENEDGTVDINLAGDYYGEVDFTMQYHDIIGDTFDWLYIDFNTLAFYAEQSGFKAELIIEGEHYDYLARITRIKD